MSSPNHKEDTKRETSPNVLIEDMDTFLQHAILGDDVRAVEDRNFSGLLEKVFQG
jgi:hypothetical protein